MEIQIFQSHVARQHMKNQQNDSCLSKKELMDSSDPHFLPEILFQNIDFFSLQPAYFLNWNVS